MTNDITWCYHMKCQNKDCERNVCHVTEFYVERSYGFFKDCEYWDLPEVYFVPSGKEQDNEQDD